MILLIGSSGYIGLEFQKQLQHNNIPYIIISYKDVTKNKIRFLIKNHNIKYIINSAAFTGTPNIEACENQKDKTISGNIILPILLKDICEEHEITLCHISTGCIYDGISPNITGWNENDLPNLNFSQSNCNFYTGSKVLAEEYIKKYSKSYIWRLRLPFEHKHNSRNYISKIINYDTLIKEPNSLSNKQEFVKACLDAIKLEIPYGIYNITNGGSVSPLDIVQKLVATIAPNKKAKFLTLDEFYNTISKMPRSNSITDNTKILSMGIKLLEINESIDRCLKNWEW